MTEKEITLDVRTKQKLEEVTQQRTRLHEAKQLITAVLSGHSADLTVAAQEQLHEACERIINVEGELKSNALRLIFGGKGPEGG